MKILFFGTASISRIYLDHLYKSGYEIFVITGTDKRAARGQRLVIPEVKVYCQEKNISYIQSESFSPEVVAIIRNLNADIGVVVSYGKLLSEEVFTATKSKVFNIHFSLLPKYRGASPVQYSLINNDKETGVTSFFVEKKLDCGDIIAQEKIAISKDENAKTLFDKLIPLGVSVMDKAIALLQTNGFKAKPQIGEATFAPTIGKKMGLVNWKKSAKEIYNLFKGLYLWPGLYSVFSTGLLSGKRIKFSNIEIADDISKNLNFGQICSFEKNKGFTVTCFCGKILVLEVQPENKRTMSAWDFLQGGNVAIGDKFTTTVF
ncbi:MAG: methionyl-tRNA formyltransferase [Elusimicrobiota bacterium]|nr:methionyl-tRNA formyltransferase [Elusimicrobiota bacterium]